MRHKQRPITLVGLLLVALAQAAPPPPKVEAESYFLLDFLSGQEIAAEAPDKRLPPASLTKIMTVYIAFDELKKGNLKLDEEVVVSERAWKTGGSRMFLEVDSRVKVKDLLKGIIVQSGNDATIALAEHIAGSEELFAELMNQYARRLGLKNTHFVNSTGLPHPDHYSTARDLSRLTRALIANFPEYYPLFALKTFTWNKIRQFNRNRLLWQDPTVDGVKTGHTEEAGFCLAASAKREGRRLISTVMRAPSEKARFEASRALLQYGFRFFETEPVAQAGRLTDVTVYKGTSDTVPLGLTAPLYVTFPKGETPKLKITAPKWLVAPVPEGKVVGEVSVIVGDQVVARRPLVVLEEVATGNLFQRAFDELKLRFLKWRSAAP